MSDPLRVHVHYAIHYAQFQLHIFNSTHVAKPLMMKPRKPMEFMAPVATFDEASMQALMDDLWGSGIRPREMKDAAQHVPHLQAHLQDMRRLVFEEWLRKDKPHAD